MTNVHEPNKTPPPPPPPPGEGPNRGDGVKPQETTTQPPQIRLAVVSGIGGFVGGLLGALVACRFCSRHHH